jgi:hypothetical protein
VGCVDHHTSNTEKSPETRGEREERKETTGRREERKTKERRTLENEEWGLQ